MSSSKDNALLKWLIMWLYSVISPIESWLGERVDGPDAEKRPRPYCELAEQLTRKEEYLGDTDALLDATEERLVRRQERQNESPRDREERITNMSFSGQRVSKGKRRRRRDTDGS